MQVTKRHIVEGVTKFIDDTLIPETYDGQLRFVLSMMKDTIKKKPETVDAFLHNPVIASSIEEDDGMYEIGHFVDTMRNILEDCECYPVTVPEVPLFSPTTKTIKISASYFQKLVNDIRTIGSYAEPETTSDED